MYDVYLNSPSQLLKPVATNVTESELEAYGEKVHTIYTGYDKEDANIVGYVYKLVLKRYYIFRSKK